jgi:tight adherence protein C
MSSGSAAEKSDWTETIVKVAGPFAKLSLPEGEWENSPLRLRFLNAGIRHPDARFAFYGSKVILPLFFSVLAFLALRGANQSQGMALLFYVLLGALFGCYLPNIIVHFMAKSRQREIFENFPDAADLMLVCVEAGLGLDAGLTKVADEIKRKSAALAEELHLTNLEIRAGGTREKSLRNLALRTGVEEIGTFATMLTQADKFGTSIGESLRVFSDDLRHKRQVRAEETAAKIPTKMLFPLVVFIFPSVVMVILGPAIIQVIRTMLPLLSKGG